MRVLMPCSLILCLLGTQLDNRAKSFSVLFVDFWRSESESNDKYLDINVKCLDICRAIYLWNIRQQRFVWQQRDSQASLKRHENWAECHAMLNLGQIVHQALMSFPSHVYKKLLGEVFVIILDIKKPNLILNCFMIHWTKKNKWKPCFCFFTDDKQHKARKLGMITLRNYAPRSYKTWFLVTLSVLDNCLIHDNCIICN